MDESLDYVETVMNQTSLEALWELHCAKMATYGFDKIIYGYTNYRSGMSLGDVEDFFILSNHQRDYLDKYIGEGLYFDGPMMKWSLDNAGAQSWSIIQNAFAAGNLTEKQMRVYEVNRSYGLSAGYTISFPTVSSRHKGAISLGARTDMSQEEVDKLWKSVGREISLINNVVHLKIQSLPYKNPERELTKRQREVLEWVGDGKTIQDIALLIERTPATVEKHLRLARDAMNVETTAQALLKASFMRQIYLLEGQN
ncbi:autoinducer binding domain-containing protein [Shimia sp. R9_1]|uniref:LuxR family transcriptional regulator n=1 Tax=unclassified Shimia TaxID=2630038 RepID=UPI001AD9A77E|nr:MULTISPECIES: LuxR family transcriptional regulator [unclassified Shimia]MBO9401520.1 autoinducer binding domain-containing protein [Shimia sp. R9_3]MBO9408264.1 autoinducer binding domain-containing protein [Shimia sp. R9_1]